MPFTNRVFVNSLFLFLCFGCAHNRKRNIDTNTIDDTSGSLIFMDSYQFIRKYNYEAEKHRVITSDGYKLTLFRIPRKGPPVLLVHGIGDSSDCWLVLGPDHSLAYQLADAGYDVWLYNARGNKYSKGHTKNIPNRLYWDFSFEEMGSKDLPPTIDYILSKTSRDKLFYVGFSQGTTIFMVMCSMRPEYNKKIAQAVLLAPVAWVSQVEYPFIEVLSSNVRELWSLVEAVGLFEIFGTNTMLNLYHARVCNLRSPIKLLCILEYYFSFGLGQITNLQNDKLPVIASHIPAGASTKTFVHFLQEIADKEFRRYDYGVERNKVIYGSSVPPPYNISEVGAPVNLFFSEKDNFSTKDNFKKLLNKLPNVSYFVVFNKSLEFTHLEFVYGARVKKLINDPVVRLLDQYKYLS